MTHYLMRVKEKCGENEFVSHQLIRANDRQMVKYHFHRTLKGMGYADTSIGKHVLEQWSQGIMTELDGITELQPVEWNVLDEHLYRWTVV